MTVLAPLPPVPAETLRLFDGYSTDVLRQPDSRSFMIGRLLEEGDSADLRWLSEAVGLEAIREWLVERGVRQLSRRSRAFWEMLFDLAPPERPDPRLWLL